MKNKYLNFFTALLLVGLFAFSVIGCSEEEEFTDAIAYYQNEESGIGKITLAFYDDNTFELHKKFEHSKKTNDKTITEDYSIATGTYTGNVASDSTITCTYKKSTSDSIAKLNNARLFGFFEKTETYGNDKFPLNTLSEPITQTYTISNGVITYEPINGIPLNNMNVKNWKLELKRK